MVHSVLRVWTPQADTCALVCRTQGRANRDLLGQDRAPTDHLNIRILPTMVSGIPLILGLGTRI